jgi:predicted nucleic acid-binding protein
MTASTDDVRSMVDTNIVVYAQDRRDAVKHAIASELLERLSERGQLVLSAQVFNEFCSVMMKPGRPGRLGPDQLAEIVRELEATGEVVPITPSLTSRALGGMTRHGLSFWDALIWAAAAENGVPVLYTEDYQHGREIEGVRIINPFLADASRAD